MEIVESGGPGVCVIQLKVGEGERASFEGFQQLVRDRLDAGHRGFVINLSGCNWIDSTGLGELVKSLVAVMRFGGNMKLAEVPPKLLGVLNVTNLSSVFEVFDSQDEAIASFKGSPR